MVIGPSRTCSRSYGTLMVLMSVGICKLPYAVPGFYIVVVVIFNR